MFAALQHGDCQRSEQIQLVTQSKEECTQRQTWAETIAQASRIALRQHGGATAWQLGGQGRQRNHLAVRQALAGVLPAQLGPQVCAQHAVTADWLAGCSCRPLAYCSFCSEQHSRLSLTLLSPQPSAVKVPEELVCKDGLQLHGRGRGATASGITLQISQQVQPKLRSCVSPFVTPA